MKVNQCFFPSLPHQRSALFSKKHNIDPQNCVQEGETASVTFQISKPGTYRLVLKVATLWKSQEMCIGILVNGITVGCVSSSRGKFYSASHGYFGGGICVFKDISADTLVTELESEAACIDSARLEGDPHNINHKMVVSNLRSWPRSNCYCLMASLILNSLQSY